MKKQLTLFTFLMLFALLKGNSQNEWSPAGATWYYGFSSWITNGYTKISYIGDTLINNTSCKIMEKKIMQFNPLSQFDTLTLNHEYTYADANKVYVYRFNHFYTLYDFSANIGDSIVVAGTDQYASSGCDSIGMIRVDSIGTMIINGIPLRYITVSPVTSSNWGWSGRIVEKIGPIYCYQNNIEPFNYLFPNKLDYCGMNIDQSHEGGFLRCYSDQSGFTYSQLDASQDCDYIFTNLNPQTNLFSNIKISANPNPATTWITFEYELPDGINSVKLLISDAQGRTVDKLTLIGKQGQKLLDTRNYSPGMYFYKAGKNEKFSGRFIVK